jgi:hypothetical protein
MRRQAIGMTAMDNFPIARQPGVMECELCAQFLAGLALILGAIPRPEGATITTRPSTVPLGRRSGSSISNRSSETRAARGARGGHHAQPVPRPVAGMVARPRLKDRFRLADPNKWMGEFSISRSPKSRHILAGNAASVHTAVIRT